jgi:LemA protein
MEFSMPRCLRSLVLGLLATLVLGGCGYNRFQELDEATTSAWSEVLNQYQRRADLVPNLVNTVRGFAEHEREVLTQVTEARSKVGQLTAGADLVNDPEAFARFQKAQGELGSALSRLMVVVENYPQLKSDVHFSALMAELAGTENRITVARQRYIRAVQAYNVLAREFPSNLTAMAFGYRTKASFTVENEGAIARPPAVDFSRPSSPGTSSTAPGSR